MNNSQPPKQIDPDLQALALAWPHLTRWQKKSLRWRITWNATKVRTARAIRGFMQRLRLPAVDKQTPPAQ